MTAGIGARLGRLETEAARRAAERAGRGGARERLAVRLAALRSSADPAIEPADPIEVLARLRGRIAVLRATGGVP